MYKEAVAVYCEHYV